MEPDFMSRVIKQGRERVMKGYDDAKKAQPNKPGHIIRTEKEQATIFKRIASLDPEDRQKIMQDMAKAAGHKGDQLDGCEVCQMVVKHAKRDKD